MPTLKTISPTPITISGVTSSNVSSSVSGNINLIQSQINQKTNTYINIKNAVNILETYSNWNGYIRLYTEVENNFDVNDIIYITYTEPIINSATTFSLDNNYHNITKKYYDNPLDDNIREISFGYKILYVNKSKNEVVINRHYNDITPGYVLSNQRLSKVSCRGGDFYNNISDGSVFYNCNILNGYFSTLQGIISGITISGSTILSGATIYYAGLVTISDVNGFYSLNIPVGLDIIKCHSVGYITNTVSKNILANTINILNIILTGGTNSISISASITSICSGATVNFTSNTVGYDVPVNFQWQVYTNGNWSNVGNDNSIFSYNLFNNNDKVRCEIRDDFDILNNTFTLSNEITISVIC